MSCNRRFYKCSICGNLIGVIENGGGELVCCGAVMEEIIPNTSEGAKEKHIPVLEYENGNAVVKVGSVPHPMLEEHYIKWIYYCTKTGAHRYWLNPGDEPRVVLPEGIGEIGAVYAYCNLHGLWLLSPASESEYNCLCGADASQSCILKD